METKTKAETFIGFSVRAGKCRVGVNAVSTLKRVELIIVCKTASRNTASDALSLSKRFGCKIIRTTEKPLQDYVHRENAKVVAITDKALSKAIINNLEKDFIELNQENLNG
ncbi:MAG: hypothetical protein E7369_02715 [Clostridiales bacterium]|nr:hypothetical protein [Clostridiales bacterium]